jgi:alkylhydroperoxidase/carboxymuconolactone decarboxylase family protein YurZ
MTGDPMNVLKTLDGELFGLVGASRKLAFDDGALSTKTKYLIALAVDASHGAVEGVRALTSLALKHGSSKEEVLEALRVTHFISGAGSIYAAARALEGLF